MISIKEFNSAQSIHLRSSDPCELLSLRKPTLNTSFKSNPILPAPGVSRNPAIDTEASRSQERRNEDAAINRNSRGVASENSGRMKAFLSCKEITNIATYNVNTLLDEDKRWELQHCSQWQYIGILAPQGGVGLLLERKARKSLLKVVPSKSGRILVAEFDGNPLTTIIVIYAPTNCAEESVIEEFYTGLRNQTNRSGNYLAEILVEFGLLAANTQFKKRPGKLWTFKCRAFNTLRQLDYILVRQKWRNSVHNAEAYNSFSTVKSDHRIVSAKIKLSFRTSKTTQKVKYDWKQFSSNPKLQLNYTFAVKNRFQIMADKSLRSSDSRVSEARQKAQEAQRQYESSKADVGKDRWSEAVNNLYQAYKLAQEEELAEQIQGNQPDVDEPEEEIPNVFYDIDINDEPFTLAEYRKVKFSLKLGKAAGPDEIPPEVFKLYDLIEFV
ncbi:craniofacial development protein 2-like [Saccostrea cucullata]|uniref:craniofacial development protein 2-like n=1 Tax=Saccostrea cuccullata TaxID=36930 RepID=UPI002ED23177